MTPLRWAWLPVTVGLAILLYRFAESSEPLDTLWRPAAAVFIFATALFIAWLPIGRDPIRSALASAALVAVALTDFPVALLLTAVLAWWAVIRTLRRRRGQPPPSSAMLSRVVGILGFALLFGAGWSVGQASVAFLSTPAGVEPVRLSAPATPPSIYLLLLDGYPRADTLSALGGSNAGFVVELHRRGFDVAERSRSNYRKTWLTLGSMLHMRYVSELDAVRDAPDSPHAQERLLHRLINRAPVVEALEEAGYRTVSIPSPFRSTALSSADKVVDGGGVTFFEEFVLRTSMFAALAPEAWRDWLAEDLRAQVRGGLEAMATVAETRSDHPVFTWTHLLAPHPPFVFDADAGPAPIQGCYPRRCLAWTSSPSLLDMAPSEHARRVRDQVAGLNHLILDGLDRVVRADPDAVVIVMSDHGIRHVPGSDEDFRSFFAARTPGGRAVFPSDISPVNVFAALFRSYFAADTEIVEYRAWLSDVPILALREVTPAP